MTKIFNILKSVQNVRVIPHFAGITRSLSNSSPKCCKKLKIMFFGTDEFALQSLRTLHSELLGDGGCVQGLEVTCLAMKTLVPATAKYAQKHKLKLHQWPPDLNLIADEDFDLGVVASFGQLIPAKVISSFPLGMINVHGSLLPRWRGAAPVIHALANGDTITGVSIMRVRPRKFDVGEVFAMRDVEVDEYIRRPELTAKLAMLGADLLLEVLRDFEVSNRSSKQQGCEGVSQAPLLRKDMALIDWETMTDVQVYNLWRAVGDLMKLRTKYSETGLPVRIGTIFHPSVLEGSVLEGCSDPPGSLRYIRRGKKAKFVCVKCSVGWVAISDIYYHNKKVMSPIDFYNGLLSRPGDHKLVKDD